MQSRGEKIFNIVNIALLLIWAFIAIYPLIYIFSASMSKPYGIISGDVLLFPKGLNFAAYEVIFKDPKIWMAYGNTFLYTIVGTAINMAFTTCGAYVLSKRNIPGIKIITLLVVMTMWFDPGMIPRYLNFRDLGLLNSRNAIFFGFAINTFNVIILRTFFESIPKSLEEAAVIDGASPWGIFTKIYLPLSKTALTTIALFYAVGRWNGYFWTMVLLRDSDKLPLQVIIRKLIVERSMAGEGLDIITKESVLGSQNLIFATIVVSIIPMMIAYPFIQKYFKKGVMIGSVKG